MVLSRNCRAWPKICEGSIWQQDTHPSSSISTVPLWVDPQLKPTDCIKYISTHASSPDWHGVHLVDWVCVHPGRVETDRHSRGRQYGGNLDTRLPSSAAQGFAQAASWRNTHIPMVFILPYYNIINKKTQTNFFSILLSHCCRNVVIWGKKRITCKMPLTSVVCTHPVLPW